MDPLLYGHNPQEGIVAVHPVDDHIMRIYLRGESGTTTEDVEFFPFFFLSDASLLSAYTSKHWIKELLGTNFYRYICAFPRWSDMWEALRCVLEQYNATASKKVGSYTELPVVYLRPDPVLQFLMQSGRTLFKGMAFHDLHRLQLDIETYTRKIPPKSQLGIDDPIIIISLSDNRGWDHIIEGRKKTEKEMLEELVGCIQERDPDVIEGHNILNFDLPYILRRSEFTGVELRIGRNNLQLISYADSPRRGSEMSRQLPYEIPGRHIIDTLQMLKAYDYSKRDLESHGLKYAAKYFGFARPERVYIKGSEIWWHWDNEPDKLIAYALDDVHEVKQLSEILSPGLFYLTQMIPLDYGVAAKTGSAAKIESLLIREYVRQKYSIPTVQQGAQTTGGYTDIFYTGILGPILYADVESLYPSIMIGKNIAPRTDELNVFPTLLKQLTAMRLDAKKRMNTTSNRTEKNRLDAMQSSYKILINSFYGYLGYSRGLFNDFVQADTVTTEGQKILRTLIEEIRRNGGTVVEVDTDGIFFIPPKAVKNEHGEAQFVRLISKPLPESIRLNIDSRYKKMLSYKKKNYALLDYHGTITIKGSSLVSRSMEPFGRKYIEQCVRSLLENNIGALHEHYVETYNAIVGRKLGIHEFARTETLRDSPEQYDLDITNQKRNRAASYEAAIGAGLKWRAGQKITYYITGSDADVAEFENAKLIDLWDPNFPDQNIAHYVKRLQELSKKFEQFFLPKDYRAIFSLDDLFDFSKQGIGILVSEVSEERGFLRDDVDSSARKEEDFPIWLDVIEEKNKEG
jgi:DNA polymerase I